MDCESSKKRVEFVWNIQKLIRKKWREKKRKTDVNVPNIPHSCYLLLVFCKENLNGIQEVGGLGMLRFFCSKCVG